MQFDFNLTITSIIALTALLSPIITAVINNCHQTKIKKIEIYESSKKSALENFIKVSTEYVADYLHYSELNEDSSYSDLKLLQKFHESVSTLYIYFKISDDSNFRQLCRDIEYPGLHSHSRINSVAILLSEQIRKE